MHVTVTIRKKRARPTSRGRSALARVDRRHLAALARALVEAEAGDRAPAGGLAAVDLSIAIGDDKWISDLNRKYRSKDAPTDVLAFPQQTPEALSRPPGRPRPQPAPRPPAEAPLPLGDVAISAETAARQARSLGHSLDREMAILLAHGILHLMGWRDDTPARRRRMMRRVEALLARIQTPPRPASRP